MDVSTQQHRDQGDPVNSACPDSGQTQRLTLRLFQDASLAFQKKSALPQNPDPKTHPFRPKGELKLHCLSLGTWQGSASFQKASPAFIRLTARQEESDKGRDTEPREPGPLCPGARHAAVSLTQPRPRPARDASVRPVPACSAPAGGRVQTRGIFFP